MKKTVLLGIVAFALIFSSSCVKNSAEYKRLLAVKDSLVVVNAKNTAEMDEILSLLNEVEDNFQSIKSAENYLSVQSGNPGELALTTKERISSDMQLVNETLEKNRQKITELEDKVKTSSLQSTQLQQTVNKLRQELDQKTKALAALTEELERKDQQISELSANLNNLSKDVQDLKTKSSVQQATINKQKKEISTVYYCFGTSAELKRQKILANNDQLSANFNRDYFIRVGDFNQLETIQLQAKKGKLISKHPSGSYEFAKDANNRAELHILDPANFWSLTKYLVVLVSM